MKVINKTYQHLEVNKTYNENCLDTMKRMPDNFIDLTDKAMRSAGFNRLNLIE